ncbi:MAG: hydrogenase small subunit [Thermodesulfovibrionales bacterium]|nr:hydrogenase small subunit [Thermodesulfovibrionales bacterium]
MGSRREGKFGNFYETLKQRGVSRREFLGFCSAMAATLSLPAGYGVKIAEALEKKQKPSVVWLEMQACTGDTESLLRASKPKVGELILDIISYDYHETIMAPAGHQAEKSLNDVVKNLKGKYIAIVEGSIPTKDGGAYLSIGGKSGLSIAREVCENAAATIAVGNCAWDGGLAAAAPNPTGAVGVKEAVPKATVVNLPGCPMNVENLTAVVVHYLTFGTLPATDSMGRPLFAYGKRIHDNCERRGHFDAGQFVRAWGDSGHRQGWCLYEMGCKGPQTYHNCPTIRWNEGTSWPVQSGHGCIGCAAPRFWDAMTPFYRRLPNVPGFGVESTADKVGVGLAAVTAAGLAAHFTVRLAKGKSTESMED